MFSTLRTRFGIPGVISVIALVFAMFGGAYAASNSSGGGKATASAAKGKPGPRGKTGKTGKTGPAGPQGPAGPVGPAGAKGDAGAAGSNGTPGAPGAPGTSVKNEAEPKGANCKEGGTKLVGSATTYACNGTNGKDGQTGFTEFLPEEKTETGTWRLVSNGEEEQYLPISFPIPLSSEAAEEVTLKTVTAEVGTTPDCPGTVEEPEANPGFLCVYSSKFGSTAEGVPLGAYKPLASGGEQEGVVSSGTLLYFASADATKRLDGTFAVTAP
jgi:hypothetical protein